jgi:hypothetical protein
VIGISYGLPAFSQPVSEEEANKLRRQFYYGRSLVMHCRYTVHDVGRDLDCKHHALFPSRDAKVAGQIIAGADYQMMVMEQEAWQASVHAVLVTDDVIRCSEETQTSTVLSGT